MKIQNTPVILASSSPYRQKLLSDYGLECEAVSPDLDEETHKDPSLPPQDLCEKLSFLKAQSLAPKHPQAVIIAADQLISFEGEILGKAGSLEQATKQLVRLSGNSHQLITSLTVLFQGQAHTQTNVTTLKMRTLSTSQAKEYVQRDQAWDCAGSYKLERAGISLFSEIHTTDHSAIIGLPLILLTETLLKLGFQLPFFSTPLMDTPL